MWTPGEYHLTDSQTNGWLQQEEAFVDQLTFEPQLPNDYTMQSNEKAHTTYMPFNYYATNTISSPSPASRHLRSVMEIPQEYQSIYKYTHFNRMQSEAMDQLLYSDENTVVSAPTGTGKTALLEMAMIRCLSIHQTRQGSIKMVYMAPTKSLCAEKVAHWNDSFGSLGIKCEEFTGDSDYATIDAIKNSSIIVTTPEKWDFMTRRWVDHRRLVELIKLMMIDEIHILKETRGAILEVCVSRMKAMGHNLRIVAVSATIPNLQDVTTWLDAKALTFSEEYRSIPLYRYVYGYPPKGANSYAFEKSLDWKLLDIISKHGDNKPVLIFCSTRSAAQSACDTLLKLMDRKNITLKLSNNIVELKNKKLYGFVQRGIGFHHAGLDSTDRRAVEQLFMNRQISVVATTSTLAVGVNLPAHLVIIKSTKGYKNGDLEEYSDIDILQMIGRAGRPGLDTFGCAVIMTTSDMEQKFNSLVSCQSIIESSLHKNLTEHLMSEICIGTVVDLESSLKWLGSTFLCTRATQNPTYYQHLYNGESLEKSPMQILQDICLKDMKLLIAHNLVSVSGAGRDARHEPTFYGMTMSRYFIQFKTMVKIMQSGNWTSIKDVLELVSQSEEFETYRYNAHEKSILNDLRTNPDIRFPLKDKVSNVPDKVFILIQCVLGDISLYHPLIGNLMTTASQAILQKARRITKCIVDCATHEKNAVKLKHSLDFYQCMNAKMWSTSPFILKQIDGIGIQTAKTLSNKNISNFEQLRACDPGRLETILHRNPPFGTKIHSFLSSLPRYHLDLQQKRNRRQHDQPTISLSVEISLTSLPKGRSQKFEKCFFTVLWIETSDHTLVDFRRIRTESLAKRSSKLEFHVLVTAPSMMVICHVQSEDFVALDIMKQLKPDVDPIQFITLADPMAGGTSATTLIQQTTGIAMDSTANDRVTALDTNMDVVENMDDLKAIKVEPPSPPLKKKSEHSKKNDKEPCKHRCNDKQRCKHLCCKRGQSSPIENTITSYPDFSPLSNHGSAAIDNNTINTGGNRSNHIDTHFDSPSTLLQSPSYDFSFLTSIAPKDRLKTASTHNSDDSDDLIDLTLPSNLGKNMRIPSLAAMEVENESDDWEITGSSMEDILCDMEILRNLADNVEKSHNNQRHTTPDCYSDDNLFGGIDISLSPGGNGEQHETAPSYQNLHFASSTATKTENISCDWLLSDLGQIIYDAGKTTRNDDMDTNDMNDDTLMKVFAIDSTVEQQTRTLDQQHVPRLSNLIQWMHNQIGSNTW